MPLAVCFFGKPALDDGTKERRGVLYGLEERSLPQLRIGLLVVDLRRTATTEGLSEANVIDTVANDARLFDV